jgi:hypothetical protein
VGFATTYATMPKIRTGATETSLTASKDPTGVGENVSFTATVAAADPSGVAAPLGMVQFTLDGASTGDPVLLDKAGKANWSTSSLRVGVHRLTADYIPGGGADLASSSPELSHTVADKSALRWWLIIVIVILLLIVLIIILLRK